MTQNAATRQPSTGVTPFDAPSGFTPFIGGRWVETEGPLNEVIDPATEEVIARGTTARSVTSPRRLPPLERPSTTGRGGRWPRPTANES